MWRGERYAIDREAGILLLSRRAAIVNASAGAMVTAWSTPSLGKVAHARHFVFVVLRGGLDGLAALPPHGDRDYVTIRGGLALTEPKERAGVIDLDGSFGLHPALAPLHERYARGEMLVLPAVATACRDRSHDLAQYHLEIGTGAPRELADRWPDRLVRLLSGARSAVGRSVGSDSGTMDLIVDLSYHNPQLAQTLLESRANDNPPRSTCGGDLILTELRSQADAFTRAAERAGGSLAADFGPCVALVESYGWDTHTDQGTHDGRLAIALAGLADGLVALARACGDAWRHTVVLVATEFGRSVAMNKMGGTDHGTASVAFLLGGAVAGGRVAGRWPGLAPDQLYEGRDLAPTTDFHAIAKAVLIQHLGLSRAAVDQFVFPNSSGVAPLANLIRV